MRNAGGLVRLQPVTDCGEAQGKAKSVQKKQQQMGSADGCTAMQVKDHSKSSPQYLGIKVPGPHTLYSSVQCRQLKIPYPKVRGISDAFLVF
jgi:hypothetical protein